MAITAANRYLSRAEMEGNAEYIARFFFGNGWTQSAVAAILGNMESESTINPAIYEDLDDTSTSNGFGLVQWTPNTKYKEWADANGYGGNYADINGQLARILYELENGLQWIPTDAYPLTFADFAVSNASPEELAQAFLYNYERPASLDQPNRSTQARAWFEFIQGFNPLDPIANQPKRMSKLLLYFGGMRHRR